MITAPFASHRLLALMVFSSSPVDLRSASCRCSKDPGTTLGRQKSVLARKIPARAAPTAPRPRDHIPIPNGSEEDTGEGSFGTGLAVAVLWWREAVWLLRGVGALAGEGWLFRVAPPRVGAAQFGVSLHLASRAGAQRLDSARPRAMTDVRLLELTRLTRL